MVYKRSSTKEADEWWARHDLIHLVNREWVDEGPKKFSNNFSSNSQVRSATGQIEIYLLVGS